MSEENKKETTGIAELFAAFVAYDKAHYHFLATNRLEVFSDGSGRVQHTKGELTTFGGFQEGIDWLKTHTTHHPEN